MIKPPYFLLKTLFVVVLLFKTVLFSSCKDTKTNPIPNVYVDLYIDLTDPLYYDLQTKGFVYITGGVNGIIIYRLNSDEYKAYDRTCPYDTDCGKIYAENASFFGTDSVCCGSKFNLYFDGMVESGPAEFPLKQYVCIYDAPNQILHIKN